MRTTRSGIKFEIDYVFISQKLEKLKEEESLQFGPCCAADSLNLGVYSSILHQRAHRMTLLIKFWSKQPEPSQPKGNE
jgi:hypothetical protein